jgi:hypothetical protein
MHGDSLQRGLGAGGGRHLRDQLSAISQATRDVPD